MTPASDIVASDIVASDIAIDVRGLSKSFGNRKVVRDLSMQVKRGTIYGFPARTAPARPPPSAC